MLSPLPCWSSSFSLSSSVFFGESVMFIPIPLACVLETVTASLFLANTYQTRTAKLLQALKNLHAEIFRRRHALAESLHVLIQIHMIEWLDDFSRNVTVEIAQVRDHARRRINLSRYGDLHDVVMPMAVRVIALAVDSLVFCFI